MRSCFWRNRYIFLWRIWTVWYVDRCITLCLCIQWVPEITHHCPKTPFLLVGTQIDLRDDPSTIEKLAKNKQKPITPETAEKLARDLKAVKYVECSALTQVIYMTVYSLTHMCTLWHTQLTTRWRQDLRKRRKEEHSIFPLACARWGWWVLFCMFFTWLQTLLQTTVDPGYSEQSTLSCISAGEESSWGCMYSME